MHVIWVTNTIKKEPTKQTLGIDSNRLRVPRELGSSNSTLPNRHKQPFSEALGIGATTVGTGEDWSPNF